tara:strand:+ start:131 stop:610 length:480 start_codon:yes stop_codon:yes gene_type:complete
MCQAYKDAQKEANQKNWATPQVTDTRTDVRMPSERSAKAKKGGCKNLREEVMQPQNWPTVQASEARQGYQDRTNGKKGSQKSLTTVVIDGHQDQANSNTDGKSQESWNTPQVDDAKNVNPSEKRRSTLVTQTGKLNPNWVEQLMGLPVGWTQLPTEWTD